MATGDTIQVLFFDVFGTVVDWRTSIIKELTAFGHAKGIEADWEAFTDAWRGLYHPSMEEVRSGRREWVNLDILHCESLVTLLDRFGIHGLSDAEIDQLAKVWHRLGAWPDSVPGLQRLKRKFIISTLSNGTVRLLVDMAKHAGLPWDAVLGSETARAYKQMPEAYLRNAALMGAEPQECMLVAAHNHDLKGASSVGFHTAFILRPTEYGPEQSRDLKAEEPWDYVAGSMTELADQLGC